MATGDTEKVSINCGAVDLGQIDLLVEQGLYSNRSDFFRTAARNQLRSHEHVIQQNMKSRTISLGVAGYCRADLEELVTTGQRLNLKMVGLVYLTSDVTPELALEAIDKIQVFGIFRASQAVKAALGDRVVTS